MRFFSLLLLVLCAAACSTARRAPKGPIGPPLAAASPAEAVVRIVPCGAERLLVSKETMTLAVLDAAGDTLACWRVACGEGLGDKVREGDRRTPEGCFAVQEILDTGRWPRPAVAREDPAWRSPYGPYFIRLLAPPHEGIGIHGTDDEASVGRRVSAGCIRLRNADLLQLLRHVRIGMEVEIRPSAADRAADEAAAAESPEEGALPETGAFPKAGSSPETADRTGDLAARAAAPVPALQGSR